MFANRMARLAQTGNSDLGYTCQIAQCPPIGGPVHSYLLFSEANFPEGFHHEPPEIYMFGISIILQQIEAVYIEGVQVQCKSAMVL